MKQPALGIKISELRKQKGLTQEELVNLCNINVRTIQRIEAGEVTPRSFTLKTILHALGEDLDSITTSENVEIEPGRAIRAVPKLQIASVAGIIYFLWGFMEFAIDYSHFYTDEPLLSNTVYVIMKVIILAAFIIFMSGFIVGGNLYKSHLLKITTFLFIAIAILFYGYDIISSYYMLFDEEYLLISRSMISGAVDLLFGYALITWKPPLGKLPQIAGGFEIASGAMFMLVFLFGLGYLFMLPAVLLEIVILYKMKEHLKETV